MQWLRASLLVVAALVTLLCQPRAIAQSSPQIVATVKAKLQARGAREVKELTRAFLFEGDGRVQEATSDEGGCIGFLALGFGEVKDVDLSLHTRAGQAIAQDTSVGPYAYARACVDAGVPLYASAQLFAGRGELVILGMRDAPRELGRLASDLALALRPGGRLEALRSVGPGSEESPVEGPMMREERALAEVGYVAVGPFAPFLLRAGVGLTIAPLEPHRCYRIMVLVPFARGVALSLESPDGRVWQAHDAASDRTTTFVCTRSAGGEFRVRAESRALRSMGLVRIFEHPEADERLADSLGDAQALSVAEASVFARARGLRLAHLGEAWVEGAVPLSWPVTMQAGQCYGVWAMGRRGLASVDVRLTSDKHVLVARTEGPPHGASVFHCAAYSGVHHLMLRPRDENGIVSVWLGRPQGSTK